MELILSFKNLNVNAHTKDVQNIFVGKDVKTFHLRVFTSILILICNDYFYMTKVICASKIQTLCYIKPNSWSKISGPRFGFLVFGLGS